MDFILTNLQNVDQAKGLVIVIDVLRAFSTTCYIVNNNAKYIIPVETREQAFDLKNKNSDYILIGERHGKPIEGFDYNNSPSQIEKVDFTDKIIIMTTTAGTKGIINVKYADEILTGSFVNSEATIKYIEQKNPTVVSFVCTDSSYYNNEDYLYASYIKSHLEKRPLNFLDIKNSLLNHPCTYGFIKEPITEHSRQDFKLCMETNKFNFVIKAKKLKDNVALYKE